MSPLVSIIMPCYNAERYIAQSIESVLAQTYTNWELLITDDCSTDNSVKIAQKYSLQDDRIKLLVSDEHHGIAGTRNLSLDRAQGRFIAFLDDDDLWMSDKLEKQITYMLDNEIGFSYTSYELIDKNGISMNKIIMANDVIDYKKYLRNTIIGCGTVTLDREIVGDFRMPNNGTSDDMALWAQLMRKGFKAYPLNEELQKHRITGESASSKHLKASHDVWLVYRECENLNLIQSSYNFVCYAFNAVKKRIF